MNKKLQRTNLQTKTIWKHGTAVRFILPLLLPWPAVAGAGPCWPCRGWRRRSIDVVPDRGRPTPPCHGEGSQGRWRRSGLASSGSDDGRENEIISGLPSCWDLGRFNGKNCKLQIATRTTGKRLSITSDFSGYRPSVALHTAFFSLLFQPLPRQRKSNVALVTDG
jgi:hypothetical protein